MPKITYKYAYRKKGRDNQYLSKWYFQFRDHADIKRRWAGFKTAAATEDLGHKFQMLADCRKTGMMISSELHKFISGLPEILRVQAAEIGLIDPAQSAIIHPLREFVSDWSHVLQSRKVKTHEIKQKTQRVLTVFTGCRFLNWNDINTNAIESFLSTMDNGKGETISQRTCNHYIQAVKQFCTWMVESGKAGKSPVANLKKKNVEHDLRYVRMIYSREEFAKLLDYLSNAPKHHGLTGKQRLALYLLTKGVGLRFTEARQLIVRDINLTAQEPHVTIQAKSAKAQRTDRVPLRKDLVEFFAAYFADSAPEELAFPGMWKDKGAEMIQKDMQAAGLPIRNQFDEVRDFHALRHTFITELAQSGVHPAVAMKLARHTDINLTLKYYTHLDLEKNAVELDKVPQMNLAAIAPANDVCSVSENCSVPSSAQKVIFSGTTSNKVRQMSSGAALQICPKEKAQPLDISRGCADENSGATYPIRTGDLRFTNKSY